MKPEWMPIYLILGFLIFQGIMRICYPFFVLIHELGHAIPAKAFGKEEVTIQLGEGSSRKQINLAGIQILMHFKKLDRGKTSYQGIPETTSEANLIILTAPITSLFLTILITAILLSSSSLTNGYTLFFSSAAWLSNFHITFSAWWPFGNPQSDILDWFKTYRAIRKKSD